jgi:hypothetical protein
MAGAVTAVVSSPLTVTSNVPPETTPPIFFDTGPEKVSVKQVPEPFGQVPKLTGAPVRFDADAEKFSSDAALARDLFSTALNATITPMNTDSSTLLFTFVPPVVWLIARHSTTGNNVINKSLDSRQATVDNPGSRIATKGSMRTENVSRSNQSLRRTFCARETLKLEIFAQKLDEKLGLLRPDSPPL